MVPMHPVRYAKVIDFLEWVRKTRPDLTCFGALTKKEFFVLAIAFEKSHGRRISKKVLASRYSSLKEQSNKLSGKESIEPSEVRGHMAF